jgi:hypothetical protein
MRRDRENLFTVATRPATIGHGERGQRRMVGKQERIVKGASRWNASPDFAAIAASSTGSDAVTVNMEWRGTLPGEPRLQWLQQRNN